MEMFAPGLTSIIKYKMLRNNPWVFVGIFSKEIKTIMREYRVSDPTNKALNIKEFKIRGKVIKVNKN